MKAILRSIIAAATLGLVLSTFAILGAQPAPGATKYFTHARVIDGTDRAPLADATIVVRDGKIVSVGAASVPASAQSVSLAGKTVIPGLVNAHGHVGNTNGLQQGQYSAENVARDLRTYAA